MSIKSEIEWDTEWKKWFSIGMDLGTYSVLLGIFDRMFKVAEELIPTLEDDAKELWSDMKEAFQEEPELKTLLLEHYPDQLLEFKRVYNLED